MSDDRTGDAASAASERDFYRRLLDIGAQDALEPLLDEALALAIEVTGAEFGYLELLDDEGGAPRFWSVRGGHGDEVTSVRVSISRGIIARSLAAGEIVETPSAITDDRFADLGSVRRHDIRAVLCVPIGGRPPIGVLYIQGAASTGALRVGARERMELFARQIAPLADRLLARDVERSTIDHTRDARERFRCPDLVGRSGALAQVLHQAALVAPLDLDVLLTGPSGTGKTALARAIAANSKRADRPFVALNCAALPDALLESELFGAERGAHSTATRRIPGKVAAAEGGTLFLDEIGELSASAQAKLLHLLQARTYHPLGSSTEVSCDVRILSATNADLKRRVAERSFREDLYYRLNVLPIRLPSLAERRDDIPLVAEYVAASVCRRHGFAPLTLARRTLLACQEAPWPGNVRELAHALEAAIIRAHGDGSAVVLEHHVFPAHEPAPSTDGRPTFQEATRQFHRRFLLERLEANDWNIAETARQLDLARSHLYTLIDALGIARAGGTSRRA